MLISVVVSNITSPANLARTFFVHFAELLVLDPLFVHLYSTVIIPENPSVATAKPYF